MGSVVRRFPGRVEILAEQKGAGQAGMVWGWTVRALQLAVMITAALLVAGAAGLGLYANAHAGRVFEGVEVAGVDVGGMSEAEALLAIQSRFDAYAGQPVELTAGEQRFLVTPAEAGARLDAAGTIDTLFAVGRTGSFWTRSQVWVRGLVRGVDVAPQVTVNASQLDARLNTIALEIVRAPQDAYVQMEVAGQPALVEEVPGVAFDLGWSRANVSDSFQRLDPGPVSLVTPPLSASTPSTSLAGSLAKARAAVAGDLTLVASEGRWTLTRADLKRVVSVDGVGGGIVVERGPLRNMLQEIAGGINRSSSDAGISRNAAGALVVVPGVDAAALDVDATTEQIVRALSNGDRDVDLVVARKAPAIDDAQAKAALPEAEALISQEVKLIWSDGEGRLTREDLLPALLIEPQPGTDDPFRFDLDRAVIRELLAPVQEEIDRPAVDARFRLVDETVTVEADAREGRALDLDEAAEEIRAAALAGKGRIDLPTDPVKPQITAADRAEIRLPDVLADSSTSYANSSEPRRQNVERAVALEDGWLVPPGGVFSYVENVGRIDEGNGFVTGFGIVAEEGGGVTTAPVVGGGICQVSTTIFQAAFWAGMPIVERYQHPYWLPSYGVAPRGMKGLDAMVNVEEDWALDMKFQNGTSDWIAVVVTADGQDVRATILGTDPNWEVEVDGPTITNVVPLDEKMYFTESSELPEGEELLVETAQEGFDSSITRTVMRDGEVLDTYLLTSSFLPSRNTTLRGTG